MYPHTIQPLTTKQKALADFIESHRRQHGSAPTYQEIARHFGFRSENAVTSHLRLMRQKGYLASDSGNARQHVQEIVALSEIYGVETVQRVLDNS